MGLTQIQFQLPVSVFKEGKKYVAYTFALDLSTSGRTIEEAKRRFGEATQLFFEELMKMGTLEQVLSDLGWEKRDQKKWLPPLQVSHEIETFAISA